MACLPFLASPDDGPILWAWHNWAPMLMDRWLMPEGEATALALDVAVLAVQYLLLFAALWAAARLARHLHHFVSPHRHRAGLIR